MVLIIESTDQQAMKAIAEVARALNAQVRMSSEAADSELSAQKARGQKWFEVVKFSTKQFKFNREEANAR